MSLSRHLNGHPVLGYTLSIVLCLLAIVQIVSSCYTFNDAPITRRSEARPAVAAREMAESGNLVIPTVNSNPRLQKPPLYYWSIVPFVNLEDRTSSIPVRLPSLVSGITLIMVLVVFSWFRHTSSTCHLTPQCTSSPVIIATFLTGMLLMSFMGFWNQVLKGEAESMLALANFLVVISLYLNLCKPNPATLISAYIISGIGLLVKGPILLLFSWPAYLWLGRRQLFADRKWHFLGLIIMLLIPSTWIIAILLRLPDAFDVFSREISMRFGDAAPHQQPFYFYLEELLVGTAPISAWVLVAVYYCWKLSKKSRPESYLVYTFAVGLTFITMLKTKQTHYLMPLYPFLAIFVGDLIPLAAARNTPFKTRKIIKVLGAVILLIGTILCIAVAIILLMLVIGDFVTGFIWLGCGLIGLAMLIYTRLKGNVVPLAIVWSCMLALAVYTVDYRIVLPFQKVSKDHTAFFRGLREISANVPIGTNIMDTRLFFYLGGRVAPVNAEAGLKKFSGVHNKSLLILDERIDRRQIPGKLLAVYYGFMDGGVWVWDMSETGDSPAGRDAYKIHLPIQDSLNMRGKENDDVSDVLSCGTFTNRVFGPVTVLSISVREDCALIEYVKFINEFKDVFVSHLTPWKVVKYEVERSEDRVLFSDLKSRVKSDLFENFLQVASVDFLLSKGQLTPVVNSGGHAREKRDEVIHLLPDSDLTISADDDAITFGVYRVQDKTVRHYRSWEKAFPGDE